MNLVNWQFAAKPGDFCNWKPGRKAVEIAVKVNR